MEIDGTFFFDEVIAGVTVDSERHVNIISNFLRPQIEAFWGSKCQNYGFNEMEPQLARLIYLVQLF